MTRAAILPGHDSGPSGGGMLALVTDGFVEWPRREANGEREDFGVKRLSESLAKYANLSAEQMIEAITADVTRFAYPSPQLDDLTMVVIRRTA